MPEVIRIRFFQSASSGNGHKEGVISPGGIGFDINCGIGLVKQRTLPG